MGFTTNKPDKGEPWNNHVPCQMSKSTHLLLTIIYNKTKNMSIVCPRIMIEASISCSSRGSNCQWQATMILLLYIICHKTEIMSMMATREKISCLQRRITGKAHDKPLREFWAESRLLRTQRQTVIPGIYIERL